MNYIILYSNVNSLSPGGDMMHFCNIAMDWIQNYFFDDNSTWQIQTLEGGPLCLSKVKFGSW